MKLKYYMRGLGIGILIATIVLSFGNKKERLSDKEIMAKARELGMIMKEEDNDDDLEKVLDKSLGKEDIEKLVVEPSNEDSDTYAHEPDNTDIESKVDSDTDIQEADNSDITSNLDSDNDSQEADNTDIESNIDSVDNEEPSDDDILADNEEPSEIIFTVDRGMSSGQVSEILMQKGLVDDAIDFDNYIKQKGKAGVIRIGTYSLPNDADYKMILDRITG